MHKKLLPYSAASFTASDRDTEFRPELMTILHNDKKAQ